MALNLFRRQVRWRAHEAARPRSLRGVASDAEVAQFYFVFRRDKNVSGLDVTVKNSGAVGHCKGTGQVGRPCAGALSSQNGWIKMVLQRFAGDVFHHQEGSAVLVDPHIVEMHNGRVGELADDLRLAEE